MGLLTDKMQKTKPIFRPTSFLFISRCIFVLTDIFLTSFKFFALKLCHFFGKVLTINAGNKLKFFPMPISHAAGIIRIVKLFQSQVGRIQGFSFTHKDYNVPLMLSLSGRWGNALYQPLAFKIFKRGLNRPLGYGKLLGKETDLYRLSAVDANIVENNFFPLFGRRLSNLQFDLIVPTVVFEFSFIYKFYISVLCFLFR